MRRAIGAGLCLMAQACISDSPATIVPSSPQSDAGSDGSSATCAPIPNNLVTNSSFETASTTSSLLTNWTAEPPLLRRTDGPDDCAAWAEHTSTNGEGFISNETTLPAEVSAGAKFELGASLRSLDGDTSPVEIELRVVNGGYNSANSQQLSETGWTRAAVELELAESTRVVAFVIRTRSARKLAFDRAYLVRK